MYTINDVQFQQAKSYIISSRRMNLNLYDFKNQEEQQDLKTRFTGNC